MKKLTYSLVYIVLMGLPALILAYLVRDVLDIRYLLIVTFVGFFIGGIFDIWAVKQGKRDGFFIWQYSPKTILGFHLFGVPIEDFVFFLFLTPILIIATWETTKRFIPIDRVQTLPLSITGLTVLAFSYWLAHKFAYKAKPPRHRRHK